MTKTIHIASSCDEKYFPGLVATFTSMVINANPEYLYHFYVIDGGIEENSKSFLSQKMLDLNRKAEIDFIKPDLSVFDGLPKMFFGSALPYARLLLPDLLQVDKVIYVDCDLLFMKDVSELWNLELRDNYAAAALDTGILKLRNEFSDLEKFNLNPEAPFFNSGVMVLNLEAFRELELHKKTLRLRSEFPEYFTFHDQSPLNVILFGKFLLLDQEWNFQTREMDIINDYEKMLRNLPNFHFSTSFKPWLIYDYNIASILYYVLMNAIGFSLNDTEFVRSRRVFEQKLRLGKILPYGYQMRSLYKQVRGDTETAGVDKKTAVFWRKKNREIRFLHSREKEIEKTVASWQNSIRKVLVPVATRTGA